MAYELSFKRGTKNWLEVAKWVAKRDHIWSTEEEEAFGEIGLDLQEGLFTEEQIKQMEQPQSMEEFFKLTNQFQNAMQQANVTKIVTHVITATIQPVINPEHKCEGDCNESLYLHPRGKGSVTY